MRERRHFPGGTFALLAISFLFTGDVGASGPEAAKVPGSDGTTEYGLIALALAAALFYFRKNIADFWKEFLSVFRPAERLKRPSFWMACVLLAATAALFEKAGASIWANKFGTSLFSWIWQAWNDPIYDSEHGKLIPFISLGLLWWKRKEILSIPARTDARGMAVVIAALGLHWMGMRGQIPRVSIFAMILLLWGMVWFVQGWPRAKIMAFPFAFLVFIIPMNFLESIIAFPMRLFVTKVSTEIGNFMGIAVMRDGTRLFDPTGAYQYDVAPACSGIRSLTAIIMLSVIYGYVTQKKIWKKALLFLAGFPLAIAGNVVRITSIIVAAQCFGQEAGNIVHEWFGFVIFLIVVLLLLAVSWLINLDYLQFWKRIRNRWNKLVMWETKMAGSDVKS